MYVHVIPFTVFALILGGWCFWLTMDRAGMADRCDQATDDADRALGHVEAVVHHLHGDGEPSTGRHARRSQRPVDGP